ncbi:hypothetical protein FVEN_g11795 [Fusarium venenatum]|nr:hypothetical protein FVEN_g11795 [Fusarium venenatum]
MSSVAWDVIITSLLGVMVVVIAVYQCLSPSTPPQADAPTSNNGGRNLSPPATFRLEILPKYGKWDASMVDKQEVKRLVREAFEVGRDVTISIESLASHPFREQLVATLTFSKIPDRMVQMGAPDQHFSDNRDLPDKSLYLDTHFHGFTPLHSEFSEFSENSENSEKSLDIIALSGLNGHAFGSFKRKGGRYMWLRDDLPISMPNCRVFIYGYNTQLQESSSFQSLEDLGIAFKDALRYLVKANRKRGHPKSLVLLGHSLGGLVIKEALCKLSEARTTDGEIVLKSLRSIMFFGTPNQGMDIKSLIPMVEGQANESFLRSLGRDSPDLRRQAQQWTKAFDNDHNSVVAKNLEIMSYYETCISPTAIQENGKWKMCGQPVELVDRFSATHGRSWEMKERYVQPIDRNHSELVKFYGRTDPAYVNHVLPRLQEFLDNLDQDSTALQYTKELCRLLEVMCAKSEPPALVEQLCESPDIEQSMAWFIESPEYRVWTGLRSARLWLQGTSGDGKTVIMSYILRSLHQPSLQTDKPDIASAFCSSEDSEAGIVASLATQLLKQNKGRAKAVQTGFPIKKFEQCREPWELTRLLWELLVASVKATTQLETVFFVDGIDALYDSVRSSFLRNFNMLQEQVAPSPIRVLVSSTVDENTKHTLAHYSSIDREKERRECLKTLAFQEWNARESRVEDKNEGGAWLSSHSGYKDWSSTSTPSVLWLEGKPGSGKSTVTKVIVRKLESKKHDLVCDQSSVPNYSLQQEKRTWTSNNPEDKRTIVARFYYSFRGGNTETSHELMLRSIVYQIWKQNSKLFRLLRDRYRELKKNMGDVREQKALWSYDDLKQALNTLHQIDFDLKVVIVVDGMDESDNDRRTDVLQFLPSLAVHHNSSCIVKVLIASRPENDINIRLRNACSHHIKLQQVNEVDIKFVVDSWIEQVVSGYKCGKDIFLFIKDHIMKHSSGVFLWVTLVLRDVEQCILNGGYSKADLDKRVAGFPKELGGKDGFYRVMIDILIKNFKGDREEQEERGRRMLAWVTFPKRPLLVGELQDVLATPPLSRCVDLSSYNLAYHRPLELIQGLLSSCGGLVEVQDSDSEQVVQLIHQTAREFLLDKSHVAEPYHLDEVQGDMEIAITCCRYIRILFTAALLQMEYDADFPQAEKLAEHLSGRELLLYALNNFAAHLDHLKRNGKEKEIRLEFESFVNDLSERCNSYACLLLWQWIKTLNWTNELSVNVNEASSRSCIRAVLSGATDTGRLDVAQVLLALRVDILHLEVQAGNVDSTRLLLEAGASIDAIDSSGRIPLYLAYENGREEIAQMLIEHGVNIVSITRKVSVNNHKTFE